jgi:hypothetical protein
MKPSLKNASPRSRAAKFPDFFSFFPQQQESIMLNRD